jgi:hypothetical protein
VVVLLGAAGAYLYSVRGRFVSKRLELPQSSADAPPAASPAQSSTTTTLPPSAPAATPPTLADLTGLPSVPTVPPPADPAAAARVQHNREAVESFPGWVGVDVRTGPFILVVVQMNDQAPATREFTSQLTTPCTVCWISANNAEGDSPHTIDPTSLEFHFADYHTLAALAPAPIVSSAKSPSDPVLTRSTAAARVEPHTVMPDIPVFFPPNADLTQATAVTMKVDGQQVVVRGQYLSVEEKAERLRATKRLQQQQQRQQQQQSPAKP